MVVFHIHGHEVLNFRLIRYKKPALQEYFCFKLLKKIHMINLMFSILHNKIWSKNLTLAGPLPKLHINFKFSAMGPMFLTQKVNKN